MDYVFAVLFIIIGVFEVIDLSKDKGEKVADSCHSNLNYWKRYLLSRLIILAGIIGILKLSGIISF